MIQRTLVLGVITIAVSAGPSVAQPKQPIGRGVVDVRAAVAGLPTTPGWIPMLPEDTIVPARKLGLEAAAHVFIAKVRGAAIGVGGSWLVAGGTTSPPALPDDAAAPPNSIAPAVTTRVASVSSQLSLNFGHALGWSHISAGFGRTRVESEATPAPGSTLVFRPVATGWVNTINFGGGARWFLTDHVGVGFDVRWYKLGSVPSSATQIGAPRTSLLTIGAGISIK